MIKNKKLVKVNLLGVLGEQVGSNWKVAVNSVSSAMAAIEILSKRKLYKSLLNNDKNGLKYRVLINNRDFLYEERLDINKLETLQKSELVAKNDKLETIDIIPVIEGAGKDLLGAIEVIAGIILIAAAIFVPGLSGFYVTLFAGLGLALLSAGVITLLSRPPTAPNISGTQGTSYLFNGPANTSQEGSPVPVGYGKLIIGSSVISASYVISEYDTGYTTSAEIPT